MRLFGRKKHAPEVQEHDIDNQNYMDSDPDLAEESIEDYEYRPQSEDPKDLLEDGEACPDYDPAVEDYVYPGAAKEEAVLDKLTNGTLEERYELNYTHERKILLRNIRRVGALMLALFVGLMSYLVYFQLTKAEELKADSGNRRFAEERNKVLRGSLYDRTGKVLSESKLEEDGSQTRRYRGGEAFGNVLGYVSDRYSITGLELKLDKTLSKATDIKSVFSKEFINSLFQPREGSTKSQEGHSVQLTLHAGLQKAAYEALAGRKGAVVALDPKTGEVLAMVSGPGFDASDLKTVMTRVTEDEAFANKAPLINRAIHATYSPGSTMKAITLGAGLTHLPGLADRTFQDEGLIEFADGSVIRNFNNNVYGELSLASAFTNSSNYVFGNLGIELTNDQLRTTAEAFGFNRSLEVEGMAPAKSKFPSYDEFEKGNKALSAIGQGGVNATPLQMAMVASAIAQDGQLAWPRLVAQVTDKNDKVVSQAGAPEMSEALSQKVAGQVQAMMARNVAQGGKAYRSLQAVSGAGKTGTGQFDGADGSRVNAWFIGYAPAKDPKIALAVVLEDLEDLKENTGAQQAIPVAKAVLEYWLD